jgi:hypothetical protein
VANFGVRAWRPPRCSQVVRHTDDAVDTEGGGGGTARACCHAQVMKWTVGGHESNFSSFPIPSPIAKK